MATLLDALDTAVNHHMAGHADAAADAYRRILTADPAQPDTLHLSGVLWAQRGDAAAAVRWIGRAVRVRPSAPAPWGHLGAALRAAELPQRAEPVLRRALALDPADGDALEALGASLHALARYPDARRWLERAARRRPGHVATLLNLGTVLRDQRRFDEAESCFDAVLARNPASSEAHLALAVGRLVRGDLRAGWEGFEHRWRRFATPPWAGEPPGGATILLHMDQGFGDAIQFVRYAPLVAGIAAQGGGRVILETHFLLYRLFNRCLGSSIQVLVRGDDPPPHDIQCPLMSLPRAFGTGLEEIPASVPYLSPNPDDVARWGDRLDGLDGTPEAEGGAGPRIGLVWAGNPHHRNDRNRSIPVAALRPLLAVPGVRFINLQSGEAAAELNRLPGVAVPAAMGRVRDFADTAAILANLDLLITVDTAIAHLAGAMGVPCWLMLPHVPDWRWLLDRADSPWYPSLRLFRQPRPGDWATALGTAAAVLKAQAARAGQSRRR
ncbi:TPR domain-containing protein (plasmid) [Azospirillum sp. B510]|uniref:tetratricopeptide repeat-containing glycosyltransferase family protein n=1 Tax=Azospirillum sp. (strain B510) TaxID=137722 RepID=UPI0001C4B7DF|nr:tetratricopeptide repeat-containing glycosyltransferase family protein [Azospirillum sp. B510]BAI74083.1 TPR domain-containing protein [Azospirillum sp. B510]